MEVSETDLLEVLKKSQEKKAKLERERRESPAGSPDRGDPPDGLSSSEGNGAGHEGGSEPIAPETPSADEKPLTVQGELFG